MSPLVASLVMMNNYFHDVATATVLAVAVVLKIVIDVHRQAPVSQKKHLLNLYLSLKKVLYFCIIWLVAGGIPRVIAFKDFELTEASYKGLLPALIVKEALAFLLVFAGVVLWIRLSRSVR